MDDLNDDAGFEELEGLETPEVDEGPESIEDSIAAAFEEVDANLEAKKADEPQKLEEEPKEESNLTKAARELASAKKGKKGPKQVVEAQDLNVPVKGEKIPKVQEEIIHPPQQWALEQKEKFNQLDPVARKPIMDFWKGLEGHSTKLFQEVNRQKQELGSTLDVINRYEKQWHSEGFTTPQMLAELAGTREMLKTDKMGTYAALGQKLGITAEALYEYQQGRGAVPQQARTPAPQFDESRFLTVDKLPQMFQSWQQQQISQQEYQTGVNGVKEMLNEVQNGRYVWPELHDDQIVERLKPLADSFKKTQPQISWAEATKQAIAFDRFQRNQSSSPSLNSAKLPSQQEIQRARQASAASVRGRGNATAATNKLPETESIEESLRAVWEGNNGSY